LGNTHRKNQVDSAVFDNAAKQRKAPIADSTPESSSHFQAAYDGIHKDINWFRPVLLEFVASERLECIGPFW
jgi:hypothetical protein